MIYNTFNGNGGFNPDIILFMCSNVWFAKELRPVDKKKLGEVMQSNDKSINEYMCGVWEREKESSTVVWLRKTLFIFIKFNLDLERQLL